MCIEEHGKTIRRRVRNLQPFAIPKSPNLSPGSIRIHDLSLVCVGQTIHIAAKLREAHPSESHDDMHSVASEHRTSLTRPDELVTRIGMCVFGDDIGEFTNGTAIVIFARVLAGPSSLTDHDTLGQRSSLLLQMYLSFNSHDIHHKWEIADSNSGRSLSGATAE
jgi:hypothetical protein